MLQGMVLGCIRPDKDVEVYLERVTRFVHVINSWSVCDTFKFGGGKRFIEAHRERLWEYLKGWMQAGGEYEIRFGVVMTMQLFIDEEHIHELLCSASTTAFGTRAITSVWAWPGPCPSASSSSPTSRCTTSGRGTRWTTSPTTRRCRRLRSLTGWMVTRSRSLRG